MIHKHTPERLLIKNVESLYKQEVMRRWDYFINGVIVGLIFGLIFGSVAGMSAHAAPLEPITHGEPIVVKSTLTFSPENTACYLAKMPKYKPIYGSTRHEIPKGSRIRWFQTIICRDFSQSPIKEFYLNQEFYK